DLGGFFARFLDAINRAFRATDSDQQSSLYVKVQREQVEVAVERGHILDLVVLDPKQHALRTGGGVDCAIRRLGQGINSADTRVLVEQLSRRARELQISKVGCHDVVERAGFKVTLA